LGDQHPGRSEHARRGDNKNLAAAAKDAFPKNVRALISGHHHTFEVMSYADDLPLQIVSGMSGSALSNALKEVAGLTINGVKVKAGVAHPGLFGFSLLQRSPQGEGWTITGYEAVTNRTLAKCELQGREIVCN
jgi:hypothetical protein